MYWGYTVRVAMSFDDVFSQGPYYEENGYDLTIGISDKGKKLEDV